MSLKFIDLGWISEPGRSKMEVLGGILRSRGAFHINVRPGAAPRMVFMRFFRGFLEYFWSHVSCFVWYLIFWWKNLICSKIVVLPKRKHHFWRSGADLEGLGSGQNEQKVVLEGFQTAMQENQWKSLKHMKKYKTTALTKCRIYHTDLMFSLFVR